MAARQLSSGGSEGTVLGQSSADKIAFHGATPVVRGAAIANITTTATGTEISVAVNAILAHLRALGLVHNS